MRGSSRSRPDTYCRPCRSAYGKEHYEANRARYIANGHARKELELRKRFEYVVDYLRAHPCTDCGESDPLVLEFDHLGDKEFNVSYGIQNIGWKRVLEEIRKCDVVCANCHRRRTAAQRGHRRTQFTEPSE
jgi:hypothetical protein